MRRYEGKGYPRHTYDDEWPGGDSRAMRFVALLAVIAWIIGALLMLALGVAVIWLVVSLALWLGGGV